MLDPNPLAKRGELVLNPVLPSPSQLASMHALQVYDLSRERSAWGLQPEVCYLDLESIGVLWV